MSEPASEPHKYGSYAANIPKYYLYATLYGIGFGLIIAIWVIYLQQRRGLSLAQVAIVDGAFWVTAALCEVPTGAVADVVGRKTSIALGVALISAALLVWGLATTLLLLILAYMMMAVGFTFLSGAQDAFLFESLNITGRRGEYTRTAGRVHALTFAATAVGGMASGLLATVDLALPIFTSAGVFLIALDLRNCRFVRTRYIVSVPGLHKLNCVTPIALGIVLTFKEPTSEQEPGGRTWKRYGEVVWDSALAIRAGHRLRYALFYLTAIAATSYIVSGFFLQPQSLQLDVQIAAIGVVVMAVQGARIAGSLCAHWLGERLGVRVVLYTMPFLMIVILIVLALFQYLSLLLLIALMDFLFAAIQPLIMNIIHNAVTDESRATVLSMQSVIFSALIVVSEPALGYTADQSGLPMAYVALAGSLGLFIIFFLWKGRVGFLKRPTANGE